MPGPNARSLPGVLLEPCPPFHSAACPDLMLMSWCDWAPPHFFLLIVCSPRSLVLVLRPFTSACWHAAHGGPLQRLGFQHCLFCAFTWASFSHFRPPPQLAYLGRADNLLSPFAPLRCDDSGRFVPSSPAVAAACQDFTCTGCCGAFHRRMHVALFPHLAMKLRSFPSMINQSPLSCNSRQELQA